MTSYANHEEDDENAPAWMSTDYDDKHRDETSPLFGTGNLDLHDPSPLQSAATEVTEGGDNNRSSNNNATTHPALQAIFSLRDVFHTTTKPGQYGSMDDNNNTDNNKLNKKNRVGQNLLLRDVIPEKDDEDVENDKNDSNNNDPFGIMDDTTIPTSAASTTDNSKMKKKKKGRQNNGDVFDQQMNQPIEANPFGKSKVPENVQQLKPHMPTQNGILWIFHLLQGIAVVTSLSLMITQILPFFLIQPRHNIIPNIGLVAVALKGYIILLCFLFILTEIDIPIAFIRNALVLQGYFSRGFLYSFVGLICVESAHADRVKDIFIHNRSNTDDSMYVDWAAIFMEVSSWCMVSMGIIYMILGICCLKRIRDRLKQQEIDKWNQYRQEMKRWNDLYA